jgi:branched-chain amino acid transport system substrate-binding protein
MLYLRWLMLFSMMVFLFAGCGGSGGDKIKIGVSGPMTGDQAKLGNDLVNGATLAVDEWNAKGGVLGKQIEIVPSDDRADPKEAVSVANKLVNEGVAGVIGHFNSSCTIPASGIYNEAKVIQISPASTNPSYTQQGFKGTFRICGRDDQQGRAAADFVVNTLQKTRIAVLHDKTTYGQGLADEFKKGLEGRASVVAYEGITKGDKDFSAVLTMIKGNVPDVIYFGGIYPEAGLLMQQLRKLGMDALFISGDGTMDPEFIKIAGNAAEGTMATYGPSVEELPSAKNFLVAYKAKYGEPGPYSIYSYDATNMLLEAIKETGSTDYEKLAGKLHEMKFSGAKGDTQFDEKGDLTVAPYIMWVVRNNKWSPFKVDTITSPPPAPPATK